MIKKFLLALLLLIPSLVFAQGAQRIGQATNNVGGFVKVLSSATVTVCTFPSCGPANLFQDPGMSVPQSNPLFADANGNYFYFVAAGNYIETVSSPGTGSRAQVVSLPTSGNSVPSGMAGMTLDYGVGNTPTPVSTPRINGQDYGMVCDDTTEDGPSFFNLLAAAAATGGTAVLPRTGSMCKISSQVFLPATAGNNNVNLEGCGAEGHDVFEPPPPPGCGLDLQYTGSSNGGYKMLSLGKGNITVKDLAIVTNAGSGDSNPFYFDAYTVVHFENVSFRGANGMLLASNVAITLGANIPSFASCPEHSTATYQDCFTGYGSSFDHIWFSHVKQAMLFGGNANGVHAVHLFGDAYNGCSSNGTEPTCSAFEFNTAGSGSGNVGSYLEDIQFEQGCAPDPGCSTSIYKYIIDFIAGTGSNTVVALNSYDGTPDMTNSPAVVHFASGIGFNYVQCGFIAPYTICQQNDGAQNYPNTILDSTTLHLGIRNLDAIHIGTVIPTDDITFAGVSASTFIQSAATSNNTIKWFATAPSTNDLIKCVTSGVICTLTDSGITASSGVLGGVTAIKTGSANNDLAGTLTASANAFSYSFTNSYVQAPVCVVQDDTAITSLLTVVITSSSVSGTTTGATDTVRYICVAKN